MYYRITFKAAASVSAYRVVAPAALDSDGVTRQCAMWLTATSKVLGVSQAGGDTGAALAVATNDGDICKAQCGASVSAGALLTVQTDTGKVIEYTTPATTTTGFVRSVGIALGKGSTDSVIDILLRVNEHTSGI